MSDVKVETQVAGTWTDITSYVRYSGRVVLDQGRTTRTSLAQPSSMTFTVDNSDFRFSPGNPMSPWGPRGWGVGSRVRTSVLAPHRHLRVDVGTNGCLTTPDSAALSITGDIDLRVDVTSDQYKTLDLVGKYLRTGNQRSYSLLVDLAQLVMRWSTDGTAFTTVYSTARLPISAGRQAMRATLDVDNGSGGYTVTFYLADTMSGTWVQFGDPVVTTAGTTSIYNSTASAYVGPLVNGSVNYTAWARARFHAAQIRSVIGGTLVADVDLDDAAHGASSFSDGTNTWTVVSPASIIGRSYRGHGQVIEVLPGQSSDGSDRYATVTAKGTLERLNSGQALGSVYYRAATSGSTSLPHLIGYWPFEDTGTALLKLQSGIGGPPVVVGEGGSAQFGVTSTFACSSGMVKPGNSRIRGGLSKGSGGLYPDQQVRFLMDLDTASLNANARLFALYMTNYSVSSAPAQWELRYGTAAGELRFVGIDEGGTTIIDTGLSVFTGSDGPCQVTIQLSGTVAGSTWTIAITRPGVSSGSYLQGTTAALVRLGRPIGFMLNPSGSAAGMGSSLFGHLTHQDAISTNLFDNYSLLSAYEGETVNDRMLRLPPEEGEVVRALGGPYSTSLGYYTGNGTTDEMGAQTPVSLLQSLRLSESTDQGVLMDDFEDVGLLYLSRGALESQRSVASLSYTGGDLRVARPITDVSLVENVVQVSDASDISVTSRVDVGPLSTLAAPDGVGVRAASYSTNLRTTIADDQAPRLADWISRVGTDPAQGWESLGVVLDQRATSPSELLDIAPGRALTVADPPTWLGYDDTDVIVIGMHEEIDQFTHDITWRTTPAEPYRVGFWGSTGSQESRWSPSDASVTAEALDTTETGVDVLVTAGWHWGHDDGDYDVVVEGERMTVTAVGSVNTSTWVQTLTVTRSVNGVVASHVTGVAIELAAPVHWEFKEIS